MQGQQRLKHQEQRHHLEQQQLQTKQQQVIFSFSFKLLFPSFTLSCNSCYFDHVDGFVLNYSLFMAFDLEKKIADRNDIHYI